MPDWCGLSGGYHPYAFGKVQDYSVGYGKTARSGRGRFRIGGMKALIVCFVVALFCDPHFAYPQIITNGNETEVDSMLRLKYVAIRNAPIDIDGFSPENNIVAIRFNKRCSAFIEKCLYGVRAKRPFKGFVDGWQLASQRKFTNEYAHTSRNIVSGSLPAIFINDMKSPDSAAEFYFIISDEHIRSQLALGGFFGVLKRFLGLVGLPSGGFFGVSGQFTSSPPEESGESRQEKGDYGERNRSIGKFFGIGKLFLAVVSFFGCMLFCIWGGHHLYHERRVLAAALLMCGCLSGLLWLWAVLMWL